MRYSPAKLVTFSSLLSSWMKMFNKQQNRICRSRISKLLFWNLRTFKRKYYLRELGWTRCLISWVALQTSSTFKNKAIRFSWQTWVTQKQYMFCTKTINIRISNWVQLMSWATLRSRRESKTVASKWSIQHIAQECTIHWTIHSE